MALQPAMFPDLEGPDFVHSQEVERVGQTVLALHGKVGGVARLHPVARAIYDEEVRVLWLLNCKPFDPEKDEEGHDTAGKCLKAPGHGRLAYATDMFDSWQDNVRAIALSLEALRAVERWGVSKGRQYTGFALLTAGPGKEDLGRQLVERHGGVREALQATHPDTGGETASERDFDAVMSFKRAQAS